MNNEEVVSATHEDIMILSAKIDSHRWQLGVLFGGIVAAVYMALSTQIGDVEDSVNQIKVNQAVLIGDLKTQVATSVGELNTNNAKIIGDLKTQNTKMIGDLTISAAAISSRMRNVKGQ